MKTSLGWKITFGFGTAVAMLAVLGVMSTRVAHQFLASAQWYDHTRQVLSSIAEIGDAVSDLEAAARGYILSGDDDYTRACQSDMARTGPAVRAVRELTSDNPRQQVYLNRVESLVATKLAVTQHMVDARRESGFTAAQQLMQVADNRQATAELQTVLRDMRDEERRLLTERAAEEHGAGQRMIAIVSIGSAIAFIAVGLAAWMIWRDMIGRRTIEQALRDGEERFRLMIDGVKDYAIFMLDAAGNIRTWNGGAERINGYKADEILGKHFSCFYLPEDIQREKPAHELTIAAERGRYEEEGWRVRRDGSRLWANVLISSIRDEKGTLRGFAKVTRDVTERKRAEDDIRKLNEALRQHAIQLESANRELEAFSYSVSHDLRAPLRAIDGFSQALLEDYAEKLDDSGRDSLARVRAATQRMGQLIDDMLNLSRVTRSEMSHEHVDLDAMAEAVVAELRKSHPGRTVTVVIRPGLTTYGDPRLLRVVLDNLIGNAWKFTSKRDDARIEFGACADGEFFVRDNGAGFDMAYAQKLFGAFQRLHAMHEFAGTGIGLATVQRVIHRHGGRVWAEGEVERGATFYFTIAHAVAMVPAAA